MAQKYGSNYPKDIKRSTASMARGFGKIPGRTEYPRDHSSLL
jgi:hypothetical protein